MDINKVMFTGLGVGLAAFVALQWQTEQSEQGWKDYHSCVNRQIDVSGLSFESARVVCEPKRP